MTNIGPLGIGIATKTVWCLFNTYKTSKEIAERSPGAVLGQLGAVVLTCTYLIGRVAEASGCVLLAVVLLQTRQQSHAVLDQQRGAHTE